MRVAVPAALAGSVLSDLVPGPSLRRLFGCAAIAVAYRVFMSSRRRDLQLEPTSGVDETPSTILIDRTGHTYRYPVVRRAEGATIVAVGATPARDDLRWPGRAVGRSLDSSEPGPTSGRCRHDHRGRACRRGGRSNLASL